MTKTIQVQLLQHTYPIYIGENILSNPQYFSSYIQKNQKILVISNTTIAPLYYLTLKNTLKDLEAQVHIIELNDGEEYKNWTSLDKIFTYLLQNNFDRQSLIIALGGGVVGDMAGFAAASFMRGIKFIQIPTTLLAQVDSSVGGKTGINHILGKNMIGAFYQPQAVITDVNTLKTLPKRQLIAGLAEVLKHAFIADINYLTYLEDNINQILNLDNKILTQTIYTSCMIKANIVQKDETEQNIRANLNFGHTFAHAIEVAMGYGNWLHGEAVGCGMVIAANLSHKLNLISYNELNRIISLIKKAQLPLISPKISIDDYITYMQKDKKNSYGDIQFILLQGLGQAIKCKVEQPVIEKVLLQAGAINV